MRLADHLPGCAHHRDVVDPASMDDAPTLELDIDVSQECGSEHAARIQRDRKPLQSVPRLPVLEDRHRHPDVSRRASEIPQLLLKQVKIDGTVVVGDVGVADLSVPGRAVVHHRDEGVPGTPEVPKVPAAALDLLREPSPEDAPGKLRVGDPSDAAGTHPELDQTWKRRNGDLAKLRRRVGVGEEDQPVRRAASNGEHVAEEVVPRVGVLDRSGDVWNLAVIAHAPR